MLTEKFLQNALTNLLSDTVEEQGRVFFASLRRSGLSSDEEISALEQEWQALIQKRKEEGAGSAENLQSLLNRIKPAVSELKLPISGED